MSEFGWVPYHTLGEIARAFIDFSDGVHVEYGFLSRLQCHCLLVSYSGLRLSDVRCWLPDNITVEYGATQDVIIFIDSNVQ